VQVQIHNPSTVWTVPPQFGAIYSHAVQTSAGPLRQLHVSGQVGVSPDGQVPPDFAGQCDAAMANVEALLADAGMGLHDLVRVTWYVVRREDLAALVRARTDRWPGVRPAVTVLLVAGLVRPEFLVEVEALAQRDETAG
jgi:enamine deaminase RidA (YjgF/YER057c/UK114 family)